MNLQQQEQFYQMISLHKERGSRAASSSVPKEDAIVTEIVNGLIVSKPAKKIEYIGEPKESEPIVIDLQAKSKAGSVPGINKLKTIRDFINGKH